MKKITNIHCINLNGNDITYTFKRSKRRSIGLKINGSGLIVSAPLDEPLWSIESILNKKASWVTQKLKQWQNKRSTELIWREDANFPFLGEPWRLTRGSSAGVQMVPCISEADSMPVKSLSLTPREIENIVMAWYYERAMACFVERIACYASKLNVPLPPLRLSRAKTQWGSCNSRGIIHLNWRLIQTPLHLIDYVVAHELSHLIEMNHSPSFWKIIERIYPDYLFARKELKKYGGW